MSVSIPRLQDLPAEIRLVIYPHIFIGSSFWIDKDDTEALPRPVVRVLGCEAHYQIALTCRLFYSEARLLWYSSTVWTFADQHMLRLTMVANALLHDNVRHLHILDLNGSSPVDWLALVPSLMTLTIDVRWIYKYSTRGPTDQKLHDDAEKSVLEGPEDDFNPGIGRISRLRRDFELSVLFKVNNRINGKWAWHVNCLSSPLAPTAQLMFLYQLAHANLDLHSLSRHEYSVKFGPDRIPDVLSMTKQILSDYVEQRKK